MDDIFYNECKNLLTPLTQKGWTFLKLQNNEIIMQKQFNELDVIKITTINHFIECVLPMKNPSFNFNKRIKNDQQSISFLKNYINDIIYV